MTDRRTQPVVLVGGPTASGKSALAVALAESFAGTVINADSMQVYRDLRVLTARPGPDELTRAPHRLYGVLPAEDVCSAARWRDLAVAEIADAHAAGRLPILVGGTGLYLRTLTEGIVELPEIPGDLRSEARALCERIGAPALHARLAARDPVMARRLAPGDRQRLIRAWEVIEATGRSLADWQAAAPAVAPGLEFASVVLLPPRAAVYAACDKRFDAMLAAGALDEVGALVARGLDPDLPAMKALGVPALRAHLRGELSLEEAAAKARQATRNYAKRQSTWFRHQMPGARIWNEKFSERFLDEIFSFIRQFLLTGAR